MERPRNSTSWLGWTMTLGERLERCRRRDSGERLRQDSLEIALPRFLLGCNRCHLVCFSFSRLIIHDIDAFVRFDDCSPQTKLHFGFGSAIKLLVDGGVIGV